MIPGVVASQLLGAIGVPGGGETIFIAVGSDNNQALPIVMTSPTGVIWTARTGAFSTYPTADLYGVATDGSRCVAVGVDSGDGTTPVILTSDDGGVTWISRTPDPATDTWLYAVAWTGSAFIAVGVDGSNSAPRVMTSPDGATWTARTADPATDMRLHAVSGKSGLAVAVGWTSANAPKIMSSANDGASWTARTSAPTTQRQLQGIVCEASRSVIVGVPTGSTTTHIQSSSDGSTWATETGAPSTGVDLYGVGHDETLFIAVGTDHALQVDPKIMTSPDGDTWTARTPDPTTGINLLGVASSGGVSVAVGRDQGFSTPFIMSSADGITWTARTPSPSSNTILNAIAGGVAAEGGIVAAVGAAAGIGNAAAISAAGTAVGTAAGIGSATGGGVALRAAVGSAAGTGVASGSSVVLWTPAQLNANLLFWWDFSNQANLTLSGSDITGVNDLASVNKDGSSVNTSPTTGTVADWNNLYGATFANVNGRIQTAASSGAAQPFGFASIFRTGSAINELEQLYGTSGTDQISLKWSGVSNQPHVFAGSAAVSRWASTLSVNTNYIDITTLNGASSLTRLNGTAGSTYSPGTTGSSSDSIGFGKFSGSFGNPQFTMGEILAFNTSLSTGDLEKIEGYLAHKFSRTADLPGGHPYKTNPPTV